MTLKKRTLEDCNNYWSAKYAELQERVRELEKDKARLDWLNDNCHCVGFATLYGDRVCEVYSVDDQRRKDFKAKNVRQAIDNARSE